MNAKLGLSKLNKPLNFDKLLIKCTFYMNAFIFTFAEIFAISNIILTARTHHTSLQTPITFSFCTECYDVLDEKMLMKIFS